MQNQLYKVAFAIILLCGLASGFASNEHRSDLCSAGSKNINGNWYCQEVDAVRYTNVGKSGTYNRVISMNSDGQCLTEPYSFSGPLSPLNEEVSVSNSLLPFPRVNLTFKGLSAFPRTNSSQAICRLHTSPIRKP